MEMLKEKLIQGSRIHNPLARHFTLHEVSQVVNRVNVVVYVAVKISLVFTRPHNEVAEPTHITRKEVKIREKI